MFDIALVDLLPSPATLTFRCMSKITPNRIVALLTPVFASLAGWLATWIADTVPGAPSVDSTELTAIFIAGALAATTAAYKWLDGWQKHERTKVEFGLDP